MGRVQNGVDCGPSGICECSEGKIRQNTCVFSFVMVLISLSVLCFPLTHRWYKPYCFVKCKELLNRLGNIWIPAESGDAGFVPLYSTLPSFLLSLFCTRDSTRKDLTPGSELLTASFTPHPHICLEGSVCARVSAGRYSASVLEEQYRNSVWKETSGNGHGRALTDQAQQGFKTGRLRCLAHLVTGNEKGQSWKGQVQNRVVTYRPHYVLKLWFLIQISSVVMRIGGGRIQLLLWNGLTL